MHIDLSWVCSRYAMYLQSSCSSVERRIAKMFNIPTPTRVGERRPRWWNARLTNCGPSPPPPAIQRPGPSTSQSATDELTLSSSPASTSQRSRAPLPTAPVTAEGLNSADSPGQQRSGAEAMLDDNCHGDVVSRLKHLQDTVNKLLEVTDSATARSPHKPRARLPKALTVSHLTCTYLYKH